MWDSHQEGVEIGTSRMGAYRVLEEHAARIKKSYAVLAHDIAKKR